MENNFLLVLYVNVINLNKYLLIIQTNHHGAEGKLNSKYRELYETSQNSFLK
jgi:hypothetical protein